MQLFRGTNNRQKGLAFLGILLLTISACGSSSTPSKQGASTGSTQGSSPGSSTGSAQGSSTAASGSPYKVVFITDESGSPLAAAATPIISDVKAFTASFNAQGGIGGHPIDVTICDAGSNNNGDATCGQTAVSDHPIAVLDTAMEETDLPYLQQANIPDFNLGLGGVQQWSNPISFDVNNLGPFGGVGPAESHLAGCKSWAQVAGGIPAAEQARYTEAATPAERLFGVSDLKNVFPPASAVDMTSYVLDAAHSGAECLYIQGSPAQFVSALQVATTLSGSPKILTAVSLMTLPGEANSLAPIVKQLGSRLVVIQAALPAVSQKPDVQQWVKDQGAKSDLENESALLWSEMRLIIQAGKAVAPNVTPAAIGNYVNHLSSYDPGVSPPVDFAQPPPPNPYGSRVFASWWVSSQDVNGTFPVTSPFIDLITGKEVTY